MPLHLVLIGPPGSGKGTQAVRLAKRYGVPHVSTGDILRDAMRSGSELGRQVGALVAQGALVSDALIADLVRARLHQPDAAAGAILDGFPRTVAQAETLDRLLGGTPTVVAHIEVAEDEIVRRLSSRKICESCRLTQSASPLDGNLDESCPYCGGALVRRDDDDAATVRRRLATYASLAGPVIAFYRDRPGFLSVDGRQPPDQVSAALFEGIDRLRPSA